MSEPDAEGVDIVTDLYRHSHWFQMSFALYLYMKLDDAATAIAVEDKKAES
jgi:hypothetical protein